VRYGETRQGWARNKEKPRLKRGNKNGTIQSHTYRINTAFDAQRQFGIHRKSHGMATRPIMTMLREGGAKVSTGKGKTTYKKQTQSGIMLDQQQFALYVNGSEIPLNPIRNLIGVTDFTKHLDVSEKLGFELMVKRARVGRTKHIRVRPMFREWVAVGSLTVLDSELTGLTQPIMQLVLDQAGALSGLCDWRPSSLASGIFGKFKPGVERLG
jgi:hypothetical protein